MIFIAGVTGFVGRHLLEALLQKGLKVRCLVRTSEKAERLRKLGIDTHQGDITDRESLKGSLDDVKLVVHLVGIIMERPGMTFRKVHVEGTENIVEEAVSSGVKHIFYQSALGASLEAPFKYSSTKAEAEEIVKASGIPYTIFRPSLIIGPEDGFTENLKEVMRLGPVVPVPGCGKARFQPLGIEDWIKAFLSILDNSESLNRIYEFGGPEHLTYSEILKIFMKVLNIKKPTIHIPIPLMKAGLPFGMALRAMGFKIPPVSSEQLDMLQVDNITDIDSMEKQFGFKPITFEDALTKALKGEINTSAY